LSKEREESVESFLVKLVSASAEVSICTPFGQTYGVLNKINAREGYLFVSPVLIQDPITEKLFKSNEGKYISLAFFNKGNLYDVLPLPKGHLDSIVKKSEKKNEAGFKNARILLKLSKKGKGYRNPCYFCNAFF